jgi:anaerobic magnesium-protoporphyrin IX monomethyl ester cyclase
MARIKVKDLNTSKERKERPHIKRFRTHSEEPADITLMNLNLMLVNQNGRFDQQNYLPLGILYLASFLKKNGYCAELIDYQTFSHAKDFDAELFIETVGKTASIVGLSTMSNLLPFTIQCAKLLKSRQSECKIILGGVGPSPVANEIVSSFPFVDSVVTGEGELTLLDLIRTDIVNLPDRKVLTDLDSLPMPAYSLLDFSLYDAAPSIITSRGCPYSCTFCTEPHNFGQNVRFRSTDSVIEEIELLHSLSGKMMFLFQDDILPLNRPRFKKMLKAFRKLSFPIEWKCFSRVDLMDEELMREMVDSGCVQVRYGIESGSNKTLKRIQKGFTIETAYEVVKKSLNFFPSVHASFIWGYPFEDVADFDTTLNWVSQFEDSGVSVLLFEYSPLPGSALYHEFKEGLKFSKDNYPFYVITGHEIVKQGYYKTKSEFDSTYQLIADYPEIFSGFYHYDNMTAAQKKQRMEHFQTTRRTPVRCKYDF